MAIDELDRARVLADAYLLGLGDLSFERVQEGASTRVYRARKGEEVLYLRILPEDGASFAPEATVHELLAGMGARVPRVVAFEGDSRLFGRSFLLTTEIRGRAIGYGPPPDHAHEILREAGRDLAAVNSLPVSGFGWIRRDRPLHEPLAAEFGTYETWLRADAAGCVDRLASAGVLSRGLAEAVDGALASSLELFGREQARLAHGDFDVTHIYHDDGRYSGIIDFGEIRGAPLLYDLGHFQIDGCLWQPYLLEGYADRVDLPVDYERRILLLGLLIATRRLSRSLAKGRRIYDPDLQFVQGVFAERFS